MNPCIQTGARIWIEPRNEMYRGDVYEVSDVMYFRLTEGSQEKYEQSAPGAQADWIIENWTNWFDRGVRPVSTVICDTLQTRKGGPKA